MVMGELSKPEIFNDKEGRPQISLNITAQSLSFSPFGKSEKPAQSNNSYDHSSMASSEDYSPSSDMNYGYYDQAAKGQGSPSPFVEDEIPF